MLNLFQSKLQIESLINKADNAKETKRLTQKFHRLKTDRKPFYITLEELNDILKWKLRKQFERQGKGRELNSNENVCVITKAAFAITHTDKDFETILKLKLLSTLTGVEVRVASAILTLCFPKQYAVIDFKNWQQIYKSAQRKTNYSPNDYIEYLKIIRQLAKKYDVTPQEIDIAIWQKDFEDKQK